MQIKKYETKDRYGNSKSFEFFEGSADMEVPGMTDMPDHPGEPKGTDTVPAWLTPGEFVINKEATDMYGPLLKNINDEGRKMQSGEQHDHPSEAMYAAAGDVVTPATQMSEDEIYRYLIDDLEFTSNAAKGIMSNFNSETGGSFSGAQAQFGGGPGRGLAQWEVGGRYDTDPTNLVKFAAQRNIDPADARTQLDFLNYEMRPNTDTLPEKLADGSNNPDYAPWRKFGDLRVRMNEAETPGEAATLFMNEYEKPGDRSQDRYTYADNYLASVDDTPPINELSLAPEITLDSTVSDVLSGTSDIPSIESETLSLTERERDAEIATIEAQLAEQEVATEDPSFLDRAGDFIGSALSNYRDSREGYRKKYVDHYGAGKGYFDSIYKESGGPVPQYYAAGDEVRDYYRSGVPMPGSAPTYSSSIAPTWETMADGIKEKVEDDQAERKRLMQLERFGSADNLSMDRLQTMRLKERLAKLKRDKAEAAYNNSTAREDAFNKEGIPAAPTMIPKYYDAFGNPYDDAEQARTSDVINEADSKAGMQKQMQINSLGQQVPITNKPFYDMSTSEAASLDDANLSLYQDMEVPEVNEPEAIVNEVKGDPTSGVANVAVGNLFEMKHGNREASMIVYQQRLIDDIADMKTKITTAIETGNPADAEYYINKIAKAELMLKKSKERLIQIQPAYDRLLSKKKNQDKEALERALKYADSIKDNELAKKIKLQLKGLKDDSTKARVEPAVVTQVKKDLGIVNDGDVESSALLNTGAETVALTSRLDGLDDGSAGGFDVETVEQKGKAEVDTGGDGDGKGDGDEKFVKTKSFLSKLFGDLLDTDELKRMAILYLGSRAMGASHNGSLAWSGKYYLKRIENKDVSHAKNVEKAIAAKLYTPASIEKYKKSRNLSHLIPIKTGGSYSLKGNRKEFYNPKLNKRDMAIEVEMTGADGVKQKYYTLNPYDKNKPGYMQPMNMDWTTDDSRVKGSKGYSSLLKTNTDLIEGQLKEWITNDITDETHPATRLTAGSKTMAGQTAEWAMSYGFDAANLGSVSQIAYENMISYMRANPKKKPGDIKVFLDAALIRQTANRGGNLFDPLDGKTPNDDRIKALNEQFMKSGKAPISTWKTFEGRSQLDLKYKNAIELFNQDMLDNPEYINKTVTNNTKPGESVFMAWLRRELSGLGPTPTKKPTK